MRRTLSTALGGVVVGADDVRVVPQDEDARRSSTSWSAMAADRRRTKIVATIGPVSSTHDAFAQLVEPASTRSASTSRTARTPTTPASAEVVREVQEETGKPLALIADLQGPKLRIGDLPAPRILLKDEEVLVVGEQRARRRRAAGRAGRDRRGAAPGPRHPDRRRPRPAAGRGGRAGPRAVPRRRRRRGEVAQGRQPARASRSRSRR